MEKLTFNNGMTVKDLKDVIREWPEIDEHGNPCEVWIGSSDGHSNQAWSLWPLNKREGSGKVWADLLLEAST